MPRKGDKPSYEQMTAHLINQADLGDMDNFIITSSSHEYQVLKKLYNSLNGQKKTVYPSNKLKLRFADLTDHISLIGTYKTCQAHIDALQNDIRKNLSAREDLEEAFAGLIAVRELGGATDGKTGT